MFRIYQRSFAFYRTSNIYLPCYRFSATRFKATITAECSTTLQAPVNAPLEFTDHRKAFKDKSLWEIFRALLVLGVCSYQSFSTRSLKMFNVMEKCLGRTVTSALVKPLFYNQFAGGVTVPQIMHNIEKMSKAGSGYFILMVLEAIEESTEALPNYYKIMEMMEGLTIDKSSPHDNYMQIRISALFTMNLLTELSLLSLEERERFIHSAAEYMKSKDSGNRYTARQQLRIHTMKESFDWLVGKVSSNDLIFELQSGLDLLEGIGQKAVDTNTVMMVDAEYTYVNPALTALALALAFRCNTDKSIIWNTTQCYLKSSLDAIRWELEFAKKNQIHYGVKVVRGAYITPESEAAKKGGYTCPVHSSHEDTCKSYDTIVEWLLCKIQANYNEGREIRFVLASHNQNSIRTAIRRMNEMDMKPEDKTVIFAQLYGMCDHITYTLGKSGYRVHKSMPAGTVSESLPYLSRRAQENTAIVINSRQERQLLILELLCRLRLKKYPRFIF